MLAVATGLLCASHAMAFDHGSMKGTGVSLYPQRNGTAPGTALVGKTVDFKVVTVGQKTWAWTNLNGDAVSADAWASQLRYWEPAKEEINLTGRADNNKQTFAATRLPKQNPLTITFFQSWNNEFYETGDFTYDYTKLNSKDDTDTEAPVLGNPVTVNQTALSLELALSATDNSGDYFYYIVDETNNFAEVSFLSDVKLTLVAEKAYNFSVYAVDFSGNMSEAKTVVVQPQAAVYITEGTAKDISFKLDSRSKTELVIECTSTQSIGDAFVKLEINGTAVDAEWKPTIAATGTGTYKITVPAAEVPGWAEGAILGLNLGYIVMPIGDWGHYVVENKVITAGANNGAPILHKIGTGVDIKEPEPMECENNLLSGITLSMGVPYLASGDAWTESNNYTTSVQDNEINITIGDASTIQWQAQFPLTMPAIPVTADKKYGITFDIETSKSVPVYMKFMDASKSGDDKNNSFLDVALAIVEPGKKTLGAYDITCPLELTQVSEILFDFGGNTAGTDIKITNIILCDQMRVITGLNEISPIDGIFIYQADDMIVINSVAQIQSAALFNINGQSLPVKLNGNSIDVSDLAKGIYILQVKDEIGNQQICKVAVK